MTNQDNLQTNSSCTETEYIEELLACDGLPWEVNSLEQEQVGKEYLADNDKEQANPEYGICQVLDDIINIVKLMASCVDDTNQSKYEVDRLIKEKTFLELQAKQISSDKSNVKQVQQDFADQVLIPQVTKLDAILDVAEPAFASDSVLDAHVKGIRILEKAFTNNLLSAGLMTKETAEQLDSNQDQQEETANE